jgi:hypothetical protein
MRNKEIRVKRTALKNIVAVLDTPCYPARYYAGYVYYMNNGYIPANNATCNFFRKLEDAYDRFNKVLGCGKIMKMRINY